MTPTWFQRVFKRVESGEPQWCVAQPRMPFGYRIESTHYTLADAERSVGRSGYLHVYSLPLIREVNRRMADPELFNKELRRMRGER